MEEQRRLYASCFRKTRTGVIKIEEPKLPIYEKPEVKDSMTTLPLSHGDVANMVHQAVSASIANTAQQLIENQLKSHVRSILLKVNDESNKKQPPCSDPSTSNVKDMHPLPHMSSGFTNAHDGRNPNLSASNANPFIMQNSILNMSHQHYRRLK